MDYGVTGDTSVWAQGRDCAQTDASKGYYGALGFHGYPKPSVSCVSDFYSRRFRGGLRDNAAPCQLLAPSEEREEPMSSDLGSEDDFLEVDDGTLFRGCSSTDQNSRRSVRGCRRVTRDHDGGPCSRS